MSTYDQNRLLLSTTIFEELIDIIVKIWQNKKSTYFFNNLTINIKTGDISFHNIIGSLGTNYLRYGLRLDEIRETDPQLYDQILIVDSKISDDLGNNLIFQLAKEFSLFDKRDISNNLLINYRSYLFLVDNYYDSYSICYVANQVMRILLEQENCDINYFNVLKIWHDKIRPFLGVYTMLTNNLGVGKVINSEIEINDKIIKYVSRDGIFELDVTDLQSEWIIKINRQELLGFLDISHLEYKPNNLTVLMNKRQFIDYGNSNRILEAKIYDINSKRGSLRNAFACWTDQLKTTTTKFISNAFPNFFTEKKDFDIVEQIRSHNVNIRVLKKKLKDYYILETSYDRIQNTFVDDLYVTSQKPSIRWYRRFGLKMQLLCLSNGGFKPHLVYVDSGINNELYLLAKKIKISSYSSSLDYVSDSLHFYNGLHLSINTKTLDKVLRKKDLLKRNQTISFAFQVNVGLMNNYKTPRIIVWGVKSKDRIKTHFSSYNEILNIYKTIASSNIQCGNLELISTESPKNQSSDNRYVDLILKVNPKNEVVDIQEKHSVSAITPDGKYETELFPSVRWFYKLYESSNPSIIAHFLEDESNLTSYFLSFSRENLTKNKQHISFPKIWLDRGLLRTSTINGDNDLFRTDLRDAKYFFQRFLTTRKVPSLSVHNSDEVEQNKTKLNLVWVDLKRAIKDLSQLAKIILRYKIDTKNDFLSNTVTQIHNCLLLNGAISHLHLDVDLLWLKIQDTIIYYEELSKSVILTSFSQISVDFDSQKEIISVNPFEYNASFFPIDNQSTKKLTGFKRFLKRLFEAYFPFSNYRMIEEPMMCFSLLYPYIDVKIMNLYAMDAFDFLLVKPLIDSSIYAEVDKKMKTRKVFPLVNFISGTLSSIDIRTTFIHNTKYLLLDELGFYKFIKHMKDQLIETKAPRGGDYESKPGDEHSLFHSISSERQKSAVRILKSRTLRTLNRSPLYRKLLKNRMIQVFEYNKIRGLGKLKIRIATVPPSIGPYPSTSQNLFSVAGNNIEINIFLLSDMVRAIKKGLILDKLDLKLLKKLQQIIKMVRKKTYSIDPKSEMYKRLTMKKFTIREFYYGVRILTLTEAIYKQKCTIQQRYQMASMNNNKEKIILPTEKDVKEKKVRTTIPSAIELELELIKENNLFSHYIIKDPIIRPKPDRDLKYIEGKKKILTKFTKMRQVVLHDKLKEEIKKTMELYEKQDMEENYDLDYFKKITNEFYKKMVKKELY